MQSYYFDININFYSFGVNVQQKDQLFKLMLFYLSHEETYFSAKRVSGTQHV